jgi:hypothetical protein
LFFVKWTATLFRPQEIRDNRMAAMMEGKKKDLSVGQEMTGTEFEQTDVQRSNNNR